MMAHVDDNGDSSGSYYRRTIRHKIHEHKAVVHSMAHLVAMFVSLSYTLLKFSPQSIPWHCFFCTL